MDVARNTILKTPPKTPNTSHTYLFYLHGLIVEFGGIRPKSDEHGYYEYELILDKFAEQGFSVISEAREQDTQVISYAEKVVTEIRGLLESGVPSQNISVVGASKGGVIASYVSLMLQEKEINYVFLAGLFERCLADQDLSLYGKILSIHDSSDTLSITPDPFFERSSGQGVFKKIVVTKGLGHGLIYQPYSDWMEPLVDWIR